MSRVLILSGLDPTGAAGLLLDVTIASRFGAVTSGFPTCLVAENFKKVEQVVPSGFSVLKRSVELCLEEGSFNATKIGLVPGSMIEDMISLINEYREGLGFVVLDPVVSASSGFAFHEKDTDRLKELMKSADLSLPNLAEFKKIFRIERFSQDALSRAAEQVSPSKILVTSFKRTENYIENLLLEKGKTKAFRTKALPFEARGTGCALSTLVCANAAKGLDIEKAISTAMSDLRRLLARSVPVSRDIRRIKVY